MTDTVGEYGVSSFGRAKLPLSHWVTKVRQWASPSYIPNLNEFANSIHDFHEASQGIRFTIGESARVEVIENSYSKGIFIDEYHP